MPELSPLRGKNPPVRRPPRQPLRVSRITLGLVPESCYYDPERKRTGVQALARVLRVSERRARALLASGRIPGARKDPVSGRWRLDTRFDLAIRAGRRGPRLRGRA